MLAGRFGWAEAVALTRVLAGDPTSHVGAALNGLAHPWTREAFILADLYDLTLSASWTKGQRPRPYPRPTDPKPNKLGDPSRYTQAEILAALRARGHGAQPTTEAKPARRQPRDARGRFCRAP